MPEQDNHFGELENQILERAVSRATYQVSHGLAQVYRRRLVAQTAAVVAAIVALVGLGVMLAVNSQTSAAARDNAGYNCRLLTSVAQILGSGNKNLLLNNQPEGFISSDALLRRNQQLDAAQIRALRPGALKSLFDDPETARLNRQSRLEDAQTTTFWRSTLIPAIDDLARVNCERHLK